MQRVKAVHRPELAGLKDVIVFPTTGNRSLADMLSGGDFDGDQAWVCWDDTVVKNFRNAPEVQLPPIKLKKKEDTFRDWRDGSPGDKSGSTPINRFLLDSFRFNMGDQLLGICTAYKDTFCYHTRSIASPEAVKLSTLLSELVDQLKQGTVFTEEDWDLFRRQLSPPPRMTQPAYKSDKNRDPIKGKAHILDFLKFNILQPLVEAELNRLTRPVEKTAEKWDSDLAACYYEFDEFIDTFPNFEAGKKLRTFLSKALQQAEDDWERIVRSRVDEESDGYATAIREMQHRYEAICMPASLVNSDDRLRAYFFGGKRERPSMSSKWNLLKASMFFQNHFRMLNMVWRLAGRQLLTIKSSMAPEGYLTVNQRPYAALRPDKRLVSHLAADGDDDESEVATFEDVDFDERGTQQDDV